MKVDTLLVPVWYQKCLTNSRQIKKDLVLLGPFFFGFKEVDMMVEFKISHIREVYLLRLQMIKNWLVMIIWQ